ncbi:HNH endonuclease [Acidobacteriota bacterium]
MNDKAKQIPSIKCIYCLLEKDLQSFLGTEHVIPQAFGKFKNNQTLNQIVCDECNQYFGKHLELYLGRDSIEGIARFRFGISPKSNPIYKRLKLRISGESMMKGVQVVPKFPDSNDSDEIRVVSQVGFFNERTKEYRYFSLEEIPKKSELESQGYMLNNKEIVFYGEIDKLVDVLKTKGMNVKITEIHEDLYNPEPGPVPVLVKARIDRTIYRAMAKIVFNYFTFHAGPDFVFREDFDGIRNFIRFDQGKGDDFFTINTSPIIYGERIHGRRRLRGHIVSIEWENTDLVGRLALYNATVGFTYYVFLCKNFRGVWLPFHKAHYFDPPSKTITELFTPKFLELP